MYFKNSEIWLCKILKCQITCDWVEQFEKFLFGDPLAVLGIQNEGLPQKSLQICAQFEITKRFEVSNGDIPEFAV